MWVWPGRRTRLQSDPPTLQWPMARVSRQSSYRIGSVHGLRPDLFVNTVWRSAGLKPHLWRTFKVSTDPRFEEKLQDVVALYLDPPDNLESCLKEYLETYKPGPPAVRLDKVGRADSGEGGPGPEGARGRLSIDALCFGHYTRPWAGLPRPRVSRKTGSRFLRIDETYAECVLLLGLKQASRARVASFGCASWHKANLEAAQRTMSQVARDEMACAKRTFGTFPH